VNELDLGPEAGVTLVELLITIVILSIAVVSIVSGLAAVSGAADRHRKQVTADVVVRSFAEAMERRVLLGAYQPCPTTVNDYAVPTSFWAPPSGYTATVTNVSFLNAITGGVNGACVLPAADQGIQQLTLRATSTDGRDTETVNLIVRQP